MNKTARKLIGILSAAVIICGSVTAGIKLTSRAPAERPPVTAAEPGEEINITLDIDFSDIFEKKNYDHLDAAVKNAADLPQNGRFAESEQMTAASGSTALELLEEYCGSRGLSLDIRKGSSTLGISDYVRGIGGLSEGDCTRHSGWIYMIDGKEPDVGMNETVLNNGDHLEIRYIVY